MTIQRIAEIMAEIIGDRYGVEIAVHVEQEEKGEQHEPL